MNPRAADLREQIAGLPSVSGIYALRAADRPPHISWSVNLSRRLNRLLVSSQTSSKTAIGKLRDALESVECWLTGSKLESSLLLYQLTKQHFPSDYLFRLRLRMPWFVGLTQSDAFPRLTVANRITRKADFLFGPFPSRDSAQHYEEQVLGLFQLRRCTDVWVPSSDHPGCIYGEMNQCLRPCQCAVTQEEYDSEVQRVSEFLASNGKGALAILQTARNRAAEETDFEQAAQIHKRIEKMNAAAALRNEAITEARSFNGVALTRGVEPGQFCLWPMVAGHWQEPLALELGGEISQTRSLDRDLRERLTQTLANPTKSGKPVEELAIFSRWYYSSWREGEWFPFRTSADLNYRRLVRELSKLAKADAVT